MFMSQGRWNHPGAVGAAQTEILPVPKLLAPLREQALSVQRFAVPEGFQDGDVFVGHHHFPFGAGEGLHLDWGKLWAQAHEQAEALAIVDRQIAADDEDVNVAVLFLDIARDRSKQNDAVWMIDRGYRMSVFLSPDRQLCGGQSLLQHQATPFLTKANTDCASPRAS